MARGHPDYKGSNSVYGQNMTDVAELAARLGSTNVLERRGSVAWVDDMTNLLFDYEVHQTGVGYVHPFLFNGYQYACTFQFNPAAADDSGSFIAKRIPFIRLNKVGFEVMFSLEHDGAFEITKPEFKLTYFDGTIAWAFRITIYPALHNFDLWTGVPYPGVDTVFMTAPFDFWTTIDANLYNYFKIVIDLNDKVFDRFVFNNIGGSLRAYPASFIANASAPHLEVVMKALQNPDGKKMYISNPIITLDEP